MQIDGYICRGCHDTIDKCIPDGLRDRYVKGSIGYYTTVPKCQITFCHDDAVAFQRVGGSLIPRCENHLVKISGKDETIFIEVCKK